MRKTVLIVILIIAMVSVTGCTDSGESSSGEGSMQNGEHVRFLSIEGDVEKNVTFNSGTPVKNDSAMLGEKDFEGTPITEFIAEAGISGNPQTIYMFSSGDGFVSSIDYKGAEDVYIYFSELKGWSTVAPNHPPAASGMDIDRIVLVSENSEVGLHIVDQNGNKSTVSMGEMYMKPQTATFNLDGTTEKDSDGKSRSVSLYTRQYSLSLSEIDKTYAGVGFVVATKSGDKYLTDGAGDFILYRQKINYREATGDIYEDVEEIQIR